MWVKDESLSPLAMLQVQKHKDIDIDSVVTEFASINQPQIIQSVGQSLDSRVS